MPQSDTDLSLLLNAYSNPTNTLFSFDLDSTLFNVRGRSEQILRQFASQFHIEKKFPQEIQFLKTFQLKDSDWGIKDALISQGFEASIDFYREIKDFWYASFFSSQFLQYDMPYSGAVEYVNTIFARGYPISYVTGRDIVRMGSGTIESLKQHNFPIETTGVELCMKPEMKISDVKYKVDEFSRLKKMYKSIVYFENEPMVINGLLKSDLDIHIIFIRSTHSKRAPEPTNLPSSPPIYPDIK